MIKRFVFMLFIVLFTLDCFIPISMAQKKGSNTFTSPTIGAKFVLIPAGTFTRGSPSSELGRFDDEAQHQVTISRSFYMQTTEVTQGQWKRVMGRNPSDLSNSGDEYPVDNVSWNNVQTFISKLNSMERTYKYRLPTEAQWEYAARAGSQFDQYGDINDIAWYNGNSGGRSHAVGQKRPNAWGLYDMLGNVSEWCQDWYGNYPSGSVTDPEGPSLGSYRVFRGGSWSQYAVRCRFADRESCAIGRRGFSLGFRLLSTL